MMAAPASNARHRAQILALLRLNQREAARRRRAEAEVERLGHILGDALAALRRNGLNLFAVGVGPADRPPSAVHEELAAGAYARGERFSLREE